MKRHDISIPPGKLISFPHDGMQYDILIPAYPVNLVVDHFIIMQGKGSGLKERMYPGDKAELFFNFGDKVESCIQDDPATIYNNILCGARPDFFDFIPPANYHLAGLRFKLFGFNQLFHIPTSQITGKNYAATDVLGKEIRFVEEQLHEVRERNAVFQVLYKWIFSCISGASLADLTIWNRLENKFHDPHLSIASLLDREMGYSRKHSIQLFKNYAGLTPKDIQKLLRFDKTRQLISQAPIKSWSSFACEAGYADQSHFIREFRSFSGFTPVEYLQVQHREHQFHVSLQEEPEGR